jgi:hypothetical protein
MMRRVLFVLVVVFAVRSAYAWSPDMLDDVKNRNIEINMFDGQTIKGLVYDVIVTSENSLNVTGDVHDDASSWVRRTRNIDYRMKHTKQHIYMVLREVDGQPGCELIIDCRDIKSIIVRRW